MYIAYICYSHSYEDDDEEQNPTICFTEPESYLYKQIIPISFHPLMRWSQKDAKLFEAKSL